MSGMWFLLIGVFLQLYFDRSILQAEDARAEQPAAILEALKNPDVHIQRLAVRAIGRLERGELADSIHPLLSSPDANVRMEAVNALGQMGASFETGMLLRSETNSGVRSVIFETAGRLREPAGGIEQLLVGGLKDSEITARTGAAKGLEVLFRTHRNMKPAPDTITALRQALKANSDPTIRELIMLTLNAAGDADADTVKLALDD